MCMLPQLTQTRLIKQIESAAAVFLSPSHRYELTPTQLAELRGVARSTIYRQAKWFQTQIQKIDEQRQLTHQLSIENHILKQRIHLLQTQLEPLVSAHLVKVDPEKLALTVLELAARHHSISDIQAITKIAFELPKPPSDGTINNIIKIGATLADHILESVEYHFPLDAIEFDELFHANSPILASLEPYSMSLLFLHQLGDCKTATWKFGFDFLDADLPPLFVHDCSAQGNALVRRLGKTSQLCVWHRIREIGRELHPQLDTIYNQALELEDEMLWTQAETLECSFKQLLELSHSLDFKRRGIRRFEQATRELVGGCVEFAYQLEQLNFKCPSLSGFELRAKEYLTHLRQWDRLAKNVVSIEGVDEFDGFELVEALGEVHIREITLIKVFEKHGDSFEYREEQSHFLDACERLRKAKSKVQNVDAIEEKFKLLVGNQVRTSSRVEALNRRLRGFTDAKRHVTERQLRLMQLHHNTTRFSADAKRAGKSPWEWLEFDVAGLKDGFMGVLREASRAADVVWPSVWALK